MDFKMGFNGNKEEKNSDIQVAEITGIKPVKTEVKVRFLSKVRSFVYCNELIDMRVGDTVFVGGEQGVVTEVSRSFEFKLAE